MRKILFILFVIFSPLLIGGCLSTDIHQYTVEATQDQNGDEQVLATRLTLKTTLNLEKGVVVDEPNWEVKTCLEIDTHCDFAVVRKCMCGLDNKKGKSCVGEKGEDKYLLSCELDPSWISENKPFYLLVNHLKQEQVIGSFKSPLLSSELLGLMVPLPPPPADDPDADADVGGVIDLVGNNPFDGLDEEANAPAVEADKGGGCFNIAGSSPSLFDFLFLGIGLAGLCLRRGFRRK